MIPFRWVLAGLMAWAWLIAGPVWGIEQVVNYRQKPDGTWTAISPWYLCQGASNRFKAKVSLMQIPEGQLSWLVTFNGVTLVDLPATDSTKVFFELNGSGNVSQRSAACSTSIKFFAR